MNIGSVKVVAAAVAVVVVLVLMVLNRYVNQPFA
jgi:hypothetical protein